MAGDEGTAVEVEQTESGVEETTEAAAAATETSATAETAAEVDFTDPAKLPAELQPLGKKLMASYTKKMQKLSKDNEKVALIDRFDSDEKFARELITYHAQRLGLLPNGKAPTSTHANGTQPDAPDDAPPPRLVASIKSRLAPELHWMAESLAAATWEGQRQTVAPLLEKQQQRDHAERTQTLEQLGAQLSEKAPGWEAHEDDMNELLAYLKSPALTHPKYGSKLEVLHSVVTRNATATQQALERMAAAGRARTTTGSSSRTVTTNVHDRVRQAKNTREAFQIAAQEAEAELRRQGVAVPE